MKVKQDTPPDRIMPPKRDLAPASDSSPKHTALSLLFVILLLILMLGGMAFTAVEVYNWIASDASDPSTEPRTNADFMVSNALEDGFRAGGASSPHSAPVPTTAPTAVAVPIEPMTTAERQRVRWPSLHLTALVGPIARINDRLYSANDTVQGVRIVAVQSSGVVIEYRGQRRVLVVDETTERWE